MFRRITCLLLVSFFCSENFAQQIFRSDNAAYKSNGYVAEFILNSDSTGWIREYYKKDFRIYFLYSGKLKHISDSVFHFEYKPVVEMGAEKRHFYQSDSMYFYFCTIDTSFTDSNFTAVNQSGFKKTFSSNDSMRTLIPFPGIGVESFTLDTRFSDPVWKKKIMMTIKPDSQPYLRYYGSKTKTETLVMISKFNSLTIQPSQDRRWWQKDRMVRLKTN